MILKPNKYLKELGIDENYWLFSKSNQGDPRYVPDEEGLDIEDVKSEIVLFAIILSLHYFPIPQCVFLVIQFHLVIG